MQRAGRQKTTQDSHEVREKALGIIRYSSAGTQLSILAEAMGMRAQFYDLAKKPPTGNTKQRDSLEEVLQGADSVNLHVDGRPMNHNMSGAREITTVGSGLGLLNLSWGFVVDADALTVVLDSGHLEGYTVDMFPEESLRNDGLLGSPLLGKGNTILIPYIDSSTPGAQENIGSFVSAKICNYIQTGETMMSVNMPTLSLQSTERVRYRMSVIHQSTPSVVGYINRIMMATNVNIESQILGTNGGVGYVTAGITSELLVAAVQDINIVDTTIRCRVVPLPGPARVDAATVS